MGNFFIDFNIDICRADVYNNVRFRKKSHHGKCRERNVGNEEKGRKIAGKNGNASKLKNRKEIMEEEE